MAKDKSLFNVKRREQIETAEKVWNVDDYAKQYKAITFVVEKVFPVSSLLYNASINHCYDGYIFLLGLRRVTKND